MKNIYFTVGPSQLYPKLEKYIQEASLQEIGSISHRSQNFMKLYSDTVTALKKLLAIPQSYYVFFPGSSLESMERIIENCVENYSFHLVNGSFSKKFYSIAAELKKSPSMNEFSPQEGIDVFNIKIPQKTELICLTHNETSNGFALPVSKINSLKSRYPKQLIAVDIVSSAPYPNIKYKNIDLAFFSIQKGFGLPAGMGVLIVSPAAIEKALFLQKKGVNIGSYHNFINWQSMAKNNQTPETPNVFSLYLLLKVSKDMLDKGISTIRQETDAKAEAIYNYFDKHAVYKPYIHKKSFRSKTTIAIDVQGESKAILEKLKQKGLVVGSGYGEFKSQHIRIANFPSIPFSRVELLLKRIDQL